MAHRPITGLDAYERMEEQNVMKRREMEKSASETRKVGFWFCFLFSYIVIRQTRHFSDDLPVTGAKRKHAPGKKFKSKKRFKRR